MYLLFVGFEGEQPTSYRLRVKTEDQAEAFRAGVMEEVAKIES
jgi:hypothetical protein